MLANLSEAPIVTEGKPPSVLWEHAQNVAAEICDGGRKADVVALDVTKEDQSEAAVPPVKRSGGGAIINFASSYGTAGAGVSTAYQSTKGAVCVTTKSATLESVGDSIGIDSICRDMCDANLFVPSVPKEARASG